MTKQELVEKLQPITSETKASFAHLFENENNILNPSGNSECVRELAKRWNTLIDLIVNDEPPMDERQEAKDSVQPQINNKIIVDEGKEFVEPEHRSDV